MNVILADIGLSHLAETFETNRLSPRDVLHLTDAEFSSLGIDRLGDRVRLREKCRDSLKDCEPTSPVAQRLAQFQERRHGRKKMKKANNRQPKSTRLITVGWKHSVKNTFTQVTETKGGGKFKVEVEKDATLDELKRKITDKYFPLGRNVIQNVLLHELDTFLATFTGQKLPERLDNGKIFTFGEFIEQYNTSPVRIYLHTELKSEEEIDIMPEDTASSIANINSTLNNNETSTTSSDPTTSSEIDVWPEDTVSNIADITLFPNRNDNAATSRDQSTDDFEESGTPTVLLRRRRINLSRSNPRFSDAQLSPVLPQSIEVQDSEDEALQEAIEASLREMNDTYPDNSLSDGSTEKTLTELLLDYGKRAIEQDTRSYLLVSRRDFLTTTFRGLQRSSFNLKGNLYVKFSGEEGLDHGGPRREFFRIALDELHESALFQGQNGSKIFQHNIDLLEKRQYRLAGQIVALSIAHDGPGPHFFNEKLYDLMVGDESELATFDLNTLSFDSTEILQELKRTENQPEMEAFLVKWGDWLVEEGIPNVWRCCYDKKKELYTRVIKILIFYRMQSEISDFISGMNDVSGLWDLVKKNPTIFKDMFCCKPKELNKDVFDTLYTVELSLHGSNQRAGEEQTIYLFESFLQDIEEGAVDVSFKDLLVFITGADHVPPRGFPDKLKINFFSLEEGIQRLPFVSTCALELHLPRGYSDPERFRDLMIRSIKESFGFEKL